MACRRRPDTKISVDDDGTVTVAGLDAPKVEAAMKRIEEITAEVEVGRTYTGKVVAIKEFGAFLEILPGQEGLCHVSELSDEFVRSVNEVCDIGDEIQVKVLDVDPLGKIKLSRKALLLEGGDDVAEELPATDEVEEVRKRSFGEELDVRRRRRGATRLVEAPRGPASRVGGRDA